MPLSFALIMVFPFFVPVARPFASILTLLLLLDQATWVVMSCFVPFENMPMAVYCRVPPNGMIAPTGKTVILVRAGGVTVRIVLANCP